MQAITLNLSEPLFRRAQLAADQLRKPMHKVITQTLENSLPKVYAPTDLSDVPAQMKDELAAMNQLSDEALQQLARSILPVPRQKVLNRLLDKQNAGTLKESERPELQQVVAESARYVLLRSKAMALLVQRGYTQAEVLALSEKK